MPLTESSEALAPGMPDPPDEPRAVDVAPDEVEGLCMDEPLDESDFGRAVLPDEVVVPGILGEAEPVAPPARVSAMRLQASKSAWIGVLVWASAPVRAMRLADAMTALISVHVLITHSSWAVRVRRWTAAPRPRRAGVQARDQGRGVTAVRLTEGGPHPAAAFALGGGRAWEVSVWPTRFA